MKCLPIDKKVGNRPKIVVCGGTGNQGSAVARALLNEGSWEVIVLTRDPLNPIAVRLAEVGASIIKADTRNVGTLHKAFAGAYGVFALTQPWNAETGKYDADQEVLQAKNIFWACREANVMHVVYSSMVNPSCRPSTVSFIDSKLKIETLLERMPLPHTIVRVGLYMQNIEIDIKNRKINGNYPDKVKVPYVSLNDIGHAVKIIFKNPDGYRNQKFNLVGDFASGKMIAELISARQNILFKYIRRSFFRQLLFHREILRLGAFFKRHKLNMNNKFHTFSPFAPGFTPVSLDRYYMEKGASNAM